MAPAALAAISERRRSSSRAKKRPMLEATLAPIWTMGPSRPPDDPVPSDTAEATSLPGPTIGRMRPPRTAMAIITLEMPDPRASGTAFHVSRPTTSPPRAGISRTAGTSGSDPKETSWTASTSMISATASSPVTRPTTAARATITASLDRRAMSSARMRRTAGLRPSERAREEIWSGGTVLIGGAPYRRRRSGPEPVSCANCGHCGGGRLYDALPWHARSATILGDPDAPDIPDVRGAGDDSAAGGAAGRRHHPRSGAQPVADDPGGHQHLPARGSRQR